MKNQDFHYNNVVIPLLNFPKTDRDVRTHGLKNSLRCQYNRLVGIVQKAHDDMKTIEMALGDIEASPETLSKIVSTMEAKYD